ncbi:hypothetical protein N8659_00385 [bacterium]|nr:hypothetical protein [bacterium]MDA7871004.1 hypothetical protein [Akkermansiaceae bacterium]MDA8959564.1 hypothetical protein [bacterium]MDB4461248.1 hypothetical protein [bacterium]MDB4470135.1 hypothetical protein [Akkermansiaceae bacterium]
MKIPFVVLVMIATQGIADAKDATTVKKESDTEFDVPKEVVAFVKQLVEKHPETKAKHASMIAPFEEKYGGNFRADPFVATEWLVPEYSTKLPETNYEGVYLVTSRMFCGFRRGYKIPYHIIAKVAVTEHSDYKAGEGDELILVRSMLTLHFDGFVDVTFTPK